MNALHHNTRPFGVSQMAIVTPRIQRAVPALSLLVLLAGSATAWAQATATQPGKSMTAGAPPATPMGVQGGAQTSPPVMGKDREVAGATADPSTLAAAPLTRWLQRLHDASKGRSYSGTFVVSAAQGQLYSARIWHACDGAQQLQRVESLSGAQRLTFRRNDQVLTLDPVSRTARVEKREALVQFPQLLQAAAAAIPNHYEARALGNQRVAGYEAELTQLEPKDSLRFGYRIWSERKSGLVLKLQTVDAQGRVLEQVAFSELQFDAPVRVNHLLRAMGDTQGYRIERSELTKTTAAQEGWVLKTVIAGFKPTSCYRRADAGWPDTVQWSFSDGLASVSLFVEPHAQNPARNETVSVQGATHSLTRRLSTAEGMWWLTAVGEVPLATLQAFAEALERKR